MTLTYVVSGFAVGMLVGLTGVGGGSLMTPLLTLLFGINPTVAVGTDLAFAAITKSAGTIAHRVKKNVHWDIVKLPESWAANSLPMRLRPSISCSINSTDFNTSRPGSVRPRMRLP